MKKGYPMLRYASFFTGASMLIAVIIDNQDSDLVIAGLLIFGFILVAASFWRLKLDKTK